MNYAILKAELNAGHPDTEAYDADAEVAAAQLNEPNRTREKTSLTGSEIFNAVDKAEFNIKTDAQKQLVWDIVHLSEINPFGIEAELFQDVFGSSITITTLQELRLEPISRAEELGLGVIGDGHVKSARIM